MGDIEEAIGKPSETWFTRNTTAHNFLMAKSLMFRFWLGSMRASVADQIEKARLMS